MDQKAGADWQAPSIEEQRNFESAKDKGADSVKFFGRRTHATIRKNFTKYFWAKKENNLDGRLE